MERHAMKKLDEWKNSNQRKPLIVSGARQVGKTWLMREFGKAAFRNVAYISFEGNPRMKQVFSVDYDIQRLLNNLQIESGVKITPDTLMIFDEIQAVPEALTSLKYFHENAPEYAILAAGSLLGVALHPQTSFPVGKVDFLDLYPMTFTEYLGAVGEEALADLLNSGDWQSITAFSSKYISHLRNYYYIGGMPAVVESFCRQQDYAEVRRIQTALLRQYSSDFSKHVSATDYPRLKLLWNSIPEQLAREDKRFYYSKIGEKSRTRDFEVPMSWLRDSGMIYQVRHLSKPGMPISAYADNIFKIYTLDIGLMGAQSNLDVKSLIEGNRVFTEFKGALTEQYVHQQLLAECGITSYYWSNPDGRSEVDFIFQNGMDIIPLEVKAEKNQKAKSLKFYCQKFQPPKAIRTSMMDFGHDTITVDTVDTKVSFSYEMINLPLYAISQIQKV